MADDYEHTIKEQSKKDIRLCEALFREADVARGRWENVVRMTFPEILAAADLQEESKKGMPICHRARQGVYKLASAHMTYITPLGDRWFQFENWEPKSDDDSMWVDKFDWFYQTTEITQNEIDRSNFHTELIATFLDRIATGTGLLLAEFENSGVLSFTHIPAGTYGLAENNLHEIDTVARKFTMTPAQLLDEFGEENVSDEILTEYNKEESRYSNKRLVYHLVEPRRDYEEGEDVLGDKLPYRSVYIDVKSQHVLLESGYYEFPYVATRFIRYGNQVYGDSALSGLEKVMGDLEKIQDALKVTAQRKAVPSVLISAELAGEVNLSAGGKTIISQTDASMGVPREWASAGDQREMLEYARMLMEQIDDATFVSMLQTISSVDRQMTAREVSARESEKIMTFTQSFTQFVADFKPMMNRLFSILFRAGKFDLSNMPESLKVYFMDEDTGYVKIDSTGQPILRRVIPPKVSYIGRMAQSLQYAQQAGLSNTLQELVDLAVNTQNPEYLLPVNAAMVARYKLNASGAPYMCTYSPKAVRKKQEEAATMQEMQMNSMLEEQQSAANRNNAQAEAAQRR